MTKNENNATIRESSKFHSFVPRNSSLFGLRNLILSCSRKFNSFSLSKGWCKISQSLFYFFCGHIIFPMARPTKPSIAISIKRMFTPLFQSPFKYNTFLLTLRIFAKDGFSKFFIQPNMNLSIFSYSCPTGFKIYHNSNNTSITEGGNYVK